MMSNSEKKRLEHKAKVGWAAYYALERDMNEIHECYARMSLRNCELVKALRQEQEVDDEKYNHLKKEFLEMYDVLKKFTECPVCYEILTKDTAKLGNCGHIVCRDCYEKLDNCPICRKKYYKRSLA